MYAERTGHPTTLTVTAATTVGFMKLFKKKKTSCTDEASSHGCPAVPDYREHVPLHDHEYTCLSFKSCTATILNTPPLSVNLHAFVIK
jgi:hypothetical protein